MESFKLKILLFFFALLFIFPLQLKCAVFFEITEDGIIVHFDEDDFPIDTVYNEEENYIACFQENLSFNQRFL